MIAKLKKIQFQQWTFAVYLLVITFLAYGILIFYQGYSFDDWPHFYVVSIEGDLLEYFKYDRPFSMWTYKIFAPLVGLNPIGWHILAVVIRWLTSLGALWILKQLWPANKFEVNGMVAIFAISPAFKQIASSVAYSQHFTTYALFLFSVGSMLASITSSRFRKDFTGLALISAIGHLFTMEYFWGLELIRPFLIWLIIGRSEKSASKKLKESLKKWWPYLGLLFLAIVWRQYFFIPVFGLEDANPNAPILINSFISNPVATVAKLGNAMVKDFHYLLVTSWSNTIQADYIDITSPFLVVSWLLVIGVITGTFFYFNRLGDASYQDDNSQKYNWKMEGIFVSLAIMFFGAIPYWITDEQITIGLFSDRFALAGMLGAAILVAVLINIVSSTKWKISLLLSILIGLGVGFHLRVANEYRWEWAEQRDFYWQLFWRAPNIQNQTPIYSEGAIFPYTGDYPTAFAINTLYNKNPDSTELSYWFFELDEKFYKDSKTLLAGTELQKGLRNYKFRGFSLNGLVIHHAPEIGNCLWILDSDDSKNEQLPNLVRQALPMSDLARISISSGDAKFYPDTNIFGDELEHGWCYYYQQAELAQQMGDWPAIVKIKETADSGEFHPNNRVELAPFISGYAHTGDLETAKALTISAYKTDPKNRKFYCSLWQDFSEFGDHDFILSVYEKLNCPQLYP
jgi:hypothetical protein